MKISRDWLQTFFEKPLPEAQVLADALTFHAFEIESVIDDILDVKVTPNRGHDCLSYRGIAKELSAILNVPLKNDPLREDVSLAPATDAVSVSIDTPLSARYIAGYIKGVKVGPSPDWLRESLKAIGQKSINNIVDATNYVMFNIGQPLHAFDAGKLSDKGGKPARPDDSGRSGGYAIVVRNARKGEKMLALDDKKYLLNENMLVIVDANEDTVIGIAGVKGGKPAGITEATKNIIIESANFDGVSVRRTAQALKLRTDASDRFQQVISPELAAIGMQQAADLIKTIAGGEVQGFVDVYPSPQRTWSVSVSLEKINDVLGTSLTAQDVEDVWKRFSMIYHTADPIFTIEVPFERLDLVIAEDLIEEVARIVGYDKIPAVELSKFVGKVEINPNFYAAEKKREELMAQGYSEVITSVFADKGERVVANKVDGMRPYLRSNLTGGLKDALERNVRNKDLLGLKEVKLFEIGTTWRGGKEEIALGVIAEGGEAEEKKLDAVVPASIYEDLPISQTERYQLFSKYPFIVRDIALWVPFDSAQDKPATKPEDVLDVIRSQAGKLLIRSEKFDEFKKGGETSYAFRLVFQSFKKTLTDAEVNAIMEKINSAVAKKDWQVR